MRELFLSICLLCTAIVDAQKNLVCYVTTVSGAIKKTNGSQLRPGDTLTLAELRSLSLPEKASITIYNSDSGSIQLPTKETGSNFIEALLDVFKSKSSRVSLSSRGDCSTGIFDDCLKTDSTINEKLLLIDSLLLPEPLWENKTENTFFLQWKCNGKVVNRALGCAGGHICIRQSDVLCEEGHDETGDQLTLGVIKKGSAGKTYHKLGTMQLYCTTSDFINGYYTTLQSIMRDKTQKEIFQRFYTELYVFYGKPDMCALKNIVHYSD